MNSSLDGLSGDFRHKYLPYDAIKAQLFAWAEAFPTIARVESIGTTPEGRDLWLLTIGPEPDRCRPAVWIDGNMHATELCGSSVALAIAEDFLRLHTDPAFDAHGLPEHVLRNLRELVVHVLPRMSPDGAEQVLETGRYVRSIPREQRPHRGAPRWVSGDVNGDGLALLMRKKDPTGELVESPDFPGLLVPRRLEDPPPYYRVFPEGHIDNWDGATVPIPDFLSDNETDLNRNFPWHWAPEPEQAGAGAYPGAEPESRAVIDWSSKHPNLFLWLNLHTYGGVVIRPLGHASDDTMDPFDLAVFRQIEAWMTAHTGYPTVSGFHEFLYEPDKPLHGDLSDYAYHQRACLSYVVELWDLFAQAGIARKKKFVDTYTHLEHEDLLRLARWDRDHNAARAIRPWTPCEHPQLGAVEVGGVDIRVGFSNPSYEKLPEVCTQQSAAFMRVAAMAPRVEIGDIQREPLGDVTRVDITVRNAGYLPTYVVGAGRKLPWNEPLYARVTTEGCRLLRPEDALVPIGHLEGWGRGKFDGYTTPLFQRSPGSSASKTFRVAVAGKGVVSFAVGSCRTGFVTTRVEVG